MKHILAILVAVVLGASAWAGNNAVAKEYTDGFGVTHPDGIHVLEEVHIDREKKTARLVFASYHSLEARAAGAQNTARHEWTSPSIDNLAAVDFDALIAWIVAAAIQLDPYLAEGTAIEVAPVE